MPEDRTPGRPHPAPPPTPPSTPTHTRAATPPTPPAPPSTPGPGPLPGRHPAPAEQIALLAADAQAVRAGVRAGGVRRVGRRRPAATELPVARVVLMTPVPHLDHVFDYEVPEALAEAAVPGVRVRVRLAGRLMDGFLLERVARSDHALVPLSSVHGPAVLTPEIAALCRSVADRYAGVLADVLRFAVPPRHARVEARVLAAGAGEDPARVVEGMPVPASWAAYRSGADLVAGIGAAQPVRALWVAGPAEPAEERIAELVRAVRARGRGVLVVAPDAADVTRIAAVLDGEPHDPVVRLGADLGPEARYRAFLRVLTGTSRIVVGTRAAVFAPVVDLGAIIVWDDGDESLAEPQSPGWHAREVAALRSAASATSLVVAGRSVTLEGARMARSGWLEVTDLPRPVLRARMPRVQVAADLGHGDPALSADRIPSVALEVLRAGVAAGPVLVSVPRAGYLPMLACQSCREQVRCPTCGGLMRAQGPERRPTCAEHPQEGPWRCPVCRGEQVRAVVVGVRRTAEEFGRALPGSTVLTSSGEDHLRTLPERRGARERLVVATPGAEPDPGPEGYAALVLLDAAASLSRPGLRTAEDVLRRWFAAAGLVRPAGQGGRVLVVGDPEVREVQALVRWDPLGYADRELDERALLHLPPAVRVAQLVGPALATGELAEELAEELGSRVLRRSGPLPVADESVGWMLAVSLADGQALSAAVNRAQVARSLRQATRVAVRMDPVRLR